MNAKPTIDDQYLNVIKSIMPDNVFTPSELHTIGFSKGIKPNTGRKAAVDSLNRMRLKNIVKRVKKAGKQNHQTFDGVPRATPVEAKFRLIHE